MGDDDAEERRRRVEDRGQATGNMRLAPDDQAERDHIVEDAHAEEGGPGPAVARHGMAGRAYDEVEGDRRRSAPGPSTMVNGGSALDQNAVEQERAAPTAGRAHSNIPHSARPHLFLLHHAFPVSLQTGLARHHSLPPPDCCAALNALIPDLILAHRLTVNSAFAAAFMLILLRCWSADKRSLSRSMI